MSGHLFDSEPFEVPLIREPRRRKDAAAGVLRDERFRNDYPPDWDRCSKCAGLGRLSDSGPSPIGILVCGSCLGMGSLKARARLEAGHRCERCKHPYVPKGDAARLITSRRVAYSSTSVLVPSPAEPSWREGGWSACDRECVHEGPLRGWATAKWKNDGTPSADLLGVAGDAVADGWIVEAAWRVLTVHHLDGDKANCRWWNLASLCQVCHLYIQHKVVMERVYVLEHSEWFKPHAAGFYAWVYLQEEVSREEALERQDELLALELATA